MTKSTGKRPFQPQRPGETLAELMARRLKPGTPEECWEWTGARLVHGYGNFGLRGTWYKAHRVAFELAHGPIPDGMIVMHRCDNPPCCNPAHLKLGTMRDNTRDMVSKGRATMHNAKLDAAKARAIRASAESATALAGRYGVSRAAILKVRKGLTWAA